MKGQVRAIFFSSKKRIGAEEESKGEGGKGEEKARKSRFSLLNTLGTATIERIADHGVTYLKGGKSRP